MAALVGVTLAVALVVLAAAPIASADLGALTGQGCIQDAGKTDCGVPTQAGLGGATGVAVSPDGMSVYVASVDDDAIFRFDRNPATGALTPQGCIQDVGSAAGCGGTEQQGLDNTRGVAVSPDGKSVYVVTTGDDAIVRFDRAADGALTGQGCIADAGDAAGCGGAAQQGLGGARAVAVSADGKSVYVASGTDDAIVRFDRDTTTGALTKQGCIQDPGVFACPTQQGLNTAEAVAVSPDGKSVYVASSTDDAIVRFDRAADGALTGQGCVADAGDVAGCGTTAQGLDSAEGVTVSADGGSVYVAGHDDDAIVRFDRAADGALTPQGCIAGAGGADCGAPTQPGLGGASGVAASPDGKSVYVTSGEDHAIVRFDRAAAGALTGQGCIADVGVAVGCGATQQGLSCAADVAVTRDGKSVYVASFCDDAIVDFDREDPPQTQIDSGPLGTTKDRTPTFTFSSDEATASFQCRVDGAAFAACSGPGASDTTAALSDGAHTFRVRAVDTFGTVDGTPASRTFTVDATAPNTIVNSGPPNGSGTSDPTPTFGFSSTEAGSTFRCRVDSGAFASCTSPRTTAALADGAHTFRVRAIDHAGNADPTPASRSFTVDTRAPNTMLTSGPEDKTRKRKATFEFKSTERGAALECKLDRRRYKPCESPKAYRRLKRGKHTFEVRAIDRAGNTDPTPAKDRWKIKRKRRAHR